MIVKIHIISIKIDGWLMYKINNTLVICLSMSRELSTMNQKYDS